MPANSNQHYVPQFYLRRFSADGASIDAILRESQKHVKNASIRGQCSKRKFYSERRGFDEFLTMLEMNVSKFLGMFAGEVPQRLPSNRDIEKLLCFLTTQMHRTPRATEIGAAFDNKLDEIIRRSSPSGDGLPEEFRARIPDHFMMIRIAFELYPHLINMMLARVKAPKGMEFVTSDNPVVLVNKAGGQGKAPQSIGIASSGLILLYPISPSHSLIMYDNGIYKSEHDRGLTIRAKPRDVEMLNKLQAKNCSNAVYFRNPDCVSLKELAASLEPDKPSKVELTEYVQVGETVTQKRYREFESGLDEGHGRDSLIGWQHLPVQEKFNVSFLKYGRKFEYDDSGSASGWFRSKRLYDLSKEFSAKVKDGRETPFEFDAFLRRKNAQVVLSRSPMLS